MTQKTIIDAALIAHAKASKITRLVAVISPQHLYHVFSPQMRVPLQHLQCLVASNGRNLHGGSVLSQKAGWWPHGAGRGNAGPR